MSYHYKIMAESFSEPMLINTGDVSDLTPVSRGILDGYAPNYELYTYKKYPEITFDDLSELSGADYPTIFYEITKKLLGGAIPDEILESAALGAFSSSNFDFNGEGNLRFTTLPSGVHIVGLADGPTGTVRDMAMQPFARWMSYLQQQENNPLTIMLSTLGYSGPAALQAFSGLENTETITMHPKGGLTRFQWSQMAKMSGQAGVHVLEVDGSFSDIIVTHIMAGLAYELSSVDSVNVAGIIAQIPYYVAAYIKAIDLEGGEIGDPVDVSIPSGKTGNGLAAIIARKMGLPLRNIILASSDKNPLATLLTEGQLKLSDFEHINFSGQDVKMPSNVWRYIGMLFENDPQKIALTYRKLKEFGSIAIKDIGIADDSVHEGIISVTVNESERAKIFRKVYQCSVRGPKILIDPETANGVAAIELLDANRPGIPMLSMEIAKPYTFNGAMASILGTHPTRPPRFNGLEEKHKDTKLTPIVSRAELLGYLAASTQARPKSP